MNDAEATRDDPLIRYVVHSYERLGLTITTADPFIENARLTADPDSKASP